MRLSWSEVSELVRYGIVGAGTTALNFAAFALAASRLGRRGQWGLVAANVLAFGVAVGHSYFWNSRWTFRRRGSPVRFLAVTLTGLIIDSLVLTALTARGVVPAAAKVVSGCGCAAWNYLALRHLVYAPDGAQGGFPLAPAAGTGALRAFRDEILASVRVRRRQR